MHSEIILSKVLTTEDEYWKQIAINSWQKDLTLDSS